MNRATIIIRLAKQAGIDAESDTLCRNEGWVEPMEQFAALIEAEALKAHQPSMQDALAAGDGTLHGAIDYWQAKCAELEAKLAQSAQPVAWMHETPGRVDVIHDEVKKLLSAAATDYLHRPIDKSEKYTIPLYAAAQPVEATVSLGPPGAADRYFFEKGYEKGKRDAQPVEVQRVGLTDVQVSLHAHNEDAGDWNDLRYRDCWYEGFKAGFRSSETAHGIKPTSSEGGA